MAHPPALLEQADAVLDLLEPPGRFVDLVDRIGLILPRPALLAQLLYRPQPLMPLLHAPAQGGQRAARQREAMVVGLGGPDEIDKIVHLGQARRIAGEEPGDPPPELVAEAEFDELG